MFLEPIGEAIAADVDSVFLICNALRHPDLASMFCAVSVSVVELEKPDLAFAAATTGRRILAVAHKNLAAHCNVGALLRGVKLITILLAPFLRVYSRPFTVFTTGRCLEPLPHFKRGRLNLIIWSLPS